MVSSKFMRGMAFICGVLWCIAASVAHAELEIKITKGVTGAMPIAVVPFGWDGANALPQDVAAIVAADLKNSGRFAPMSIDDMTSRPTDAAQVNFQEWRLLKADNLVVGKVRPSSSGYTVQFQLFDVYRSVQLSAYSLRPGPDELRRTAHKIADIIYETLTGQPGVFATRIAYITEQPADKVRRYSLQIADADGYHPQPVLYSGQPLLSPAWSPDGRRLAYVSMENHKSELYVQELVTRRRERIAAFNGHNGAPAWSPDGSKLALTLSKDGNPEIYVVDLATKQLQRLTNHPAIDTEPVWSPDGKSIIFTSDRGGGPQIYRMPAGGGAPQRLTYEGNYNARPAVSSDGKHIAFVHGEGMRYHIAMLDVETRQMQVLTDGALDESPSFAPNGSMVIYAAREKGRGVLRAVSGDGTVGLRLPLQEGGDAREPVWSPFNP